MRPEVAEVIVPWRSNGCQHRIKAWEFVRGLYPLGELGWWAIREAPGASPWIKASAVMPAVAESRADIVVLADADVWCDGLAAAISAVRDGAAWAIPHHDVFRLSEAGTAAYMAGANPLTVDLAQPPYPGMQGGGYVVARRETLLEVPLDPFFVGWGNEDWAHGFALHTLKGPAWRGTEPLIHLWHPPAPRLNRKHGSAENIGRWMRYRDARKDQDQMRALLEEARVSLGLDQHTVHADSA